tara:strand:- start:1424 stop:2290 length:867 start_codon:yes stop_codon:yes gene_type:complete
MATINLGSLKLNWTGAYNSSTSYAVDDIATANGNSYVCIQAHSNQAVGNATAYWNIMSSAGTNGTDVAATLNNKEIAFKTNAGAVDGIPIGSAGEFLKVNSGATGYEYGAVSSDFVKIGSTTTSGNATSVTLDIFNNTYKNYVVYVNDLTSSGGDQLYMRFRSSGGDESGSAYTASWGHSYRTSGGDGMDSHSQWNSSAIRLAHNGIANQTAYAGQYVLTFPNPSSTTSYKTMLMHCTQWNASESQLDNYMGAGTYVNNSSTAITGFKIYLGGGYINNGATFSYYGIK